MNKLVQIPKRIPPRSSIGHSQKIPKIIWQTMSTNVVPAFIKRYADTWIDLNPEYEYRLCDDKDIIDFIREEFPEFLDGYLNLKYGAAKADLWRYLMIYKYGGVYADMDCKCLNPLREWIRYDSSFVTQIGTNKDICQWLIISEPLNPIFLRAAEKTLDNLKNNNSRITYHGFTYNNNLLEIITGESLLEFNHAIWALSGPAVLQAAAEECLKEGLLTEILKYTQVECVSGTSSCQMGGKVIHDTGNVEYKKAYRQLGLKHYNGRLARVKRMIGLLFSNR